MGFECVEVCLELLVRYQSIDTRDTRVAVVKFAVIETSEFARAVATEGGKR